MPPCNRFTSKLKHTGDRNAASYRGRLPVRLCSGSRLPILGNSAQCFAALHFPSLHAEAAPHGGIFTLADTRCILRFYGVLFVCVLLFWLSFLCFGACVTDAVFEKRGIPALMLKDFAYASVCFLSIAMFRRRTAINER
jgi:hypothetical protein